MPQKIPLIIICVVVVLLLAPYAGCNAGRVQRYTTSDESPHYRDAPDEHLPHSNREDRSSSSNRDETLTTIDDLLAD